MVSKHATLLSSNFVQAPRLKFVVNSSTRWTVATKAACVHDSSADFGSFKARAKLDLGNVRHAEVVRHGTEVLGHDEGCAKTVQNSVVHRSFD